MVVENVRYNVEIAKQSELLGDELKKGVMGFVLDTRTGALTQV